MINMTELGKAMESMRKTRGLTRDVLAKTAGVHFNTISNLEKGRSTNVRLSTLSGIATALDVDVYQLIRATRGEPCDGSEKPDQD